MKFYTCKACGYTWQSANPILECARFGCGSRLIAEAGVTAYGGGIPAPLPPYANAPASVPAGSLGTRIFLWFAAAFYIFVAFVSLSPLIPFLMKDGGVGAFLMSGVLRMGAFLVSLALVLIGSLFFLTGFILCLVKMHRAWQVVQPAAGLGRGLNVPTPGQAIGFLFIPLFNFYWMFVAFVGLMDAADALREKYQPREAPFGGGTAATYCVCSILICLVSLFGFWMSALALSLTAISCLLLAGIASDAARIVNTLQKDTRHDHYMQRL